MAKPGYRIPRNRAQESSHFVLEKLRVEKYFPCFKCDLKRRRLLCRGTISPSEGCDTYGVRIEYEPGCIPRVFITNPIIEPLREYHIYREGSLCLYDHRDAPWYSNLKIHETIIPWTAEWLVFYELWKLTGEWHGPAAPHGANEKMPERKVIGNL